MKNNNYPTWLVPLEIAIKLKEIGFKEKCLCYWHEYFHRIECSTDDEDRLCPEYYDYNTDESTTSLPTWEQVFEWFRDRKYYGTLNTYKDGFSFYCEINYNNQYIKVYSKTYEEVREELVKALIQTYKNEQL
ncbi:hypothetical protein [Capnocytophaga granulosa]|uniref:hypothetical protein n=1 Tax=Capnocytophaga granulosa TaxID=45242 RepID=UPI0028EC615A|nr:hypothetical protein [Capnocytophaga granulosa]